jgi:hypothetical protein
MVFRCFVTHSYLFCPFIKTHYSTTIWSWTPLQLLINFVVIQSTLRIPLITPAPRRFDSGWQVVLTGCAVMGCHFYNRFIRWYLELDSRMRASHTWLATNVLVESRAGYNSHRHKHLTRSGVVDPLLLLVLTRSNTRVLARRGT